MYLYLIVFIICCEFRINQITALLQCTSAHADQLLPYKFNNIQTSDNWYIICSLLRSLKGRITGRNKGNETAVTDVAV
jgi:hypothetical protein